jgi:ABC-type multidrug transport system ATPase subunit
VIALVSVHARASGKPDSRLVDLSLSWERGVLAVLGARVDGTTALLEVLAGLVRPRAGVALAFGEVPQASRARIAYVPLAPSLPDALRVDEVCELAARLRGEAPSSAASRLALLGLEHLASRPARTLSRGEARAVSLAIALGSSARLLLVEEPLVGLEPTAPARVIELLRARGASGVPVVVTTASVRDATALADQLGVLTRGVFAHLSPALAHVGDEGAHLRVVVASEARADAAPLVAALAEDPAVTKVELSAFAATRVLHAAVVLEVTGAELLAVARAVQVASARTGIDVEAIESAVTPLEAIRARLSPRSGLAPPPGARP